jgi:tRNA 5-methylaminomethyl-2-thiouridine biosynthesis bifunctional protein
LTFFAAIILKLPCKVTFHQFRKISADLRRSAPGHQHWPELAPWAEQLQAQWPPAIAGCHRLLLDDGRITLDLWFGDINDADHELDDSLNQQVDAWFLDGLPRRKIRTCGHQICSGQWRAWPTGRHAGHLYLRRFCPPRPAGSGLYHAENKGFGRKREMLTGEMARR